MATLKQNVLMLLGLAVFAAVFFGLSYGLNPVPTQSTFIFAGVIGLILAIPVCNTSLKIFFW